MQFPLKQPYAIERLDELKESAHKHCGGYCDAMDLHEIAHGENLEWHAEGLIDGSWRIDFFPSLSWWIEVAQAVANGRDPEWRPDVVDAVFEGKLPQMVQHVLEAYPAALQDTSDLAGSDLDTDQRAVLELFRRYRLFTEQIREKARETWPEVDLAWLWVQP